MTLSEKINKQEVIINELFSSLVEVPKSIETHASFFRNKIKQLFLIEMEFYGIKTPKEADISFEDNEDTDCCAITRYSSEYRDGKLIVRTPNIAINNLVYFDLFSHPDKNKRMNGCKAIIQSLFHEITHVRKYHLVLTGFSDYTVLRNAKEMLLNSDKDLYRDVYLRNHHRFMSEAEADFTAYSELENYMTLDSEDLRSAREHKSNIKVSYLLVPSKGIIDRDEYIDMLIDRKIAKEKAEITLYTWRILLKEYNTNFKPRRLSELIRNYKTEISLIEGKIDDPDIKKIFIDGANSLYFELFNKRILCNNRFELYEALQEHGPKEVEHILNILKWYNAQEKNRKSNVVKEKLKADSDIPRFGINRGYIANPKKNFKDTISTIDFMNSIKLKTDNPNILAYLKSEQFRNLLPEFGYYIFKTGEKISIEEFINNLFIPRLMFVNDPSHYHDEFKYSMNLYTKLTAEIEATMSFETINKRYQALDNQITKYLNMKIVKGKKETNLLDAYTNDLVQTMEMVVNICEGDDSIFELFEAGEADVYGYKIKQFNSGQVLLFRELDHVALLLSEDETFNPKKINYYNKLQRNQKYEKLSRDMAMYSIAYSGKGGQRR